MKRQVLTTEQMNHLRNIGIDTSKASMMWVNFYETLSVSDDLLDLRLRDRIIESNHECVLSFTMQDILAIMPDVISVDNVKYHLCVCNSYVAYEQNYIDIIEDLPQLSNISIRSYMNEDMILNTYLMLCWLAENKLIK